MILALLAALAMPTTIPFDLVDNRVLVPVVVNGRGPYRLLLDTGAPGLTLRDEVAHELGLTSLATSEDRGVGDVAVRSTSSRVQSVVIGGHDLGPLDCNSISFADAPALWGTERLDGILGLPVFERWAVTIDYDKRTVILASHAARDGIRIPIEFSGHIPIVTATILGSGGRFGVDTGARSSLLVASPFIAAHRLDRKLGVTQPMITGWGIGGPVRSRLARLSLLRIGPIAVRGIVARLSTQAAGGLTTGDIDGLIGPGVLARFIVTFDYRNHELLLQKNERFARPDAWDGTGMWLSQRGDAFEVLDVLPDGPAAAAGLRAGEQIIAIDGRVTKGLSLPEERLRLYFEGRRARTVRFTLSNGREVRVVLRAIV
ncbi:MAG: aspartyl protease family protein [Thermoanaerobaculia bacterium]